MKLLLTHQKNFFLVLQKEFDGYEIQTVNEDIDNHLRPVIEVFRANKISQNTFYSDSTRSNESNNPIAKPQSRVEYARHRIFYQFVSHICNVIIVPVELVKFKMVKVNIFCKCELTSV